VQIRNQKEEQTGWI